MRPRREPTVPDPVPAPPGPPSLAPTNKLVCSLDRLFATVSTFLRCGWAVLGRVGAACCRGRATDTCALPPPNASPIRVIVTPGVACLQVKLMVAFLLVFSLSFLAWSRGSKSMSDFRTRHILWHVVSAASLAWLADVEGAGRHHVPLVDVAPMHKLLALTRSESQ